MKITERSYKNLDKSIKVVGIEDIKFEQLDSLIGKLQKGSSLQQYVATVPEKIIGNEKELVFDGISFVKSKETKGLIKDSKNIEDVVVLLLDLSQEPKSKKSVANDPYLGIKNLCLDRKSIVLFYSPGDRDIDIFIHNEIEKEVISSLKK